MACGDIEEVTVTDWNWCWTWHGPWLCKETKVERRYAYDFVVFRRRYRGFTATFRGCCEIGGGEFSWTEWTWRLYWNPPDEANVHKTFKNQLQSTGPCTLVAGLNVSPRLEGRIE